MANPKTAKVQTEIDKAKARLIEQQLRLKELENRKTEIENTEIVEIVRGFSIPLDELAPLLRSLRESAPVKPLKPGKPQSGEEESGGDSGE